MLSFRDPAAIEALHAFADLTEDDDLAVAIVKRLDAIADESVQLMGQPECVLTGHDAKPLVCDKRWG